MNDKIDKVIELLEQAKVLIAEIESALPTSVTAVTIPITLLNIPTKSNKTRFQIACASVNIVTVDDLIKYGKARFIRLENVGRKVTNEVSEVLEQLNLYW